MCSCEDPLNTLPHRCLIPCRLVTLVSVSSQLYQDQTQNFVIIKNHPTSETPLFSFWTTTSCPFISCSLTLYLTRLFSQSSSLMPSPLFLNIPVVWTWFSSLLALHFFLEWSHQLHWLPLPSMCLWLSCFFSIILTTLPRIRKKHF